VHLAYIACPLLGDLFYGTEDKDEVHRIGNGETSVPSIERQALHSSSIRFIHPVKKKEMHFSIPLPADMQTVMDVGEKAK
jgi:pseudouridylate synthase